VLLSIQSFGLELFTEGPAQIWGIAFGAEIVGIVFAWLGGGFLECFCDGCEANQFAEKPRNTLINKN
jgi:hypothetical protein